MTLLIIPLGTAASLEEPGALYHETASNGSNNLLQGTDPHLISTGTPPPVPVNVTVSGGEFSDKIRVSWGSPTPEHQVFIPLIFSSGGSPGSIPDLISFQVFRSPTPSTQDATQLTDTHPASPYDDVTAEPGVTYYYWVKACNSAGCSDFSVPASGWRAETIPPPPSGLSASQGEYTDKVHLTWTASENAIFYIIIRHTTDNPEDGQVISDNHLISSFGDTTAEPGESYHYWVKACNSAGCSDFSAPASGWRAVSVPTAPDEVLASQGTFTDRVSISWSLSESASHYQVYRNTIQSVEGAWQLTSNHSSSPFDDTSTVPGTTYHYWIKACNSAGCSDYSSPATGWRGETLPSPPISVSASNGTFADHVQVSWASSDHAIYYMIYRNSVGTTDGAVPFADHHPDSPYEDTSAEPGTIYYYWVKACNSAGCSDFSSPDSGWRAVVLEIPTPPTDVTASNGGYTGKVHLTWTDSEGAATYEVYRNTNENPVDAEQLTNDHPGSPFDDTTAEPGITYFYWVKACNSVGCSDFSFPDSGWWAETLPMPPVGLTASKGHYTDRVHLSWTASEGASFYHVFRNTVNSHTGEMVIAENLITTLLDDTSAEPGVTYYYWVKACNSAGCSAYSSPASGWRAEITPAAPTGLTASNGAHTDKVRLTWTASEHAKFYRVYRNTNDNHAGEIVLTENLPNNLFEDLTAEPGTTYYYWVKACNSAGCSNYSTSASGWRAETVPTAPTGLTASEGDYSDKINLSWIGSENARYYQIYRNTSNNHEGQIVLEYSHPNCTYDDWNAEPGITYYYWVKACNSAGCSAYSSPAQGWRAETIPLPPIAITASDGTYTDKVLLSWTVPEGAAYYKVYRNTINSHDGESTLSEYHPSNSFEDPSAVPEVIYYYWVKACNSAGCSSYSTPDSGWRALVNIANGDFEAGNDSSWSIYSKRGRNLILHEDFTPIPSHSGNYLAWLGGENDEISHITQSINILSSHPYLHFWYQIYSQDICDYDYARIRINGSTFMIFDLCSPKNTEDWTPAVLNLSMFAGSTVILQFEVTTDLTYISSFFLDDITLSSNPSPAVRLQVDGIR